MTYNEALSRLSAHYGANEGRAILRLLLETRFNLSWTDVLAGAMEDLGDAETKDLENLLRRLEWEEPVQYILGVAEFCGRNFSVAPGVLIPRLETEELVAVISRECGGGGVDCRVQPRQDEVKARANEGYSGGGGVDCRVQPRQDEVKAVLDMGTGSGCIALTLALDHPDWRVTGVDVSDSALLLARKNAMRHNVAGVDFRKADILKRDSLPAGPWDVIVSNPPYICEEEKKTMSKNVLFYEPHEALFVPTSDPLLFYRAISDYARESLAPGGRLFLEINRRFGEKTATLLREWGFSAIRVIKDQFANDRIVTAQWNPDANDK